MVKNSNRSWVGYKHLIVITKKGLVSREMYSLPMYSVMSVKLYRSVNHCAFGLCMTTWHIREESGDSISLENSYTMEAKWAD